MLINSKEIGVNEGRHWDYLGSILQNTLRVATVSDASDILVLAWCTIVTYIISTMFAFCICYILIHIHFLNIFFLSFSKLKS